MRALVPAFFALTILGNFFASFSEAAIPHSKTIVSRLARNSGRGVYVIEQEVRFSGSEGIVLKERWLVQSGDVMRLVVQGGDFRMDALYRDGRRTVTGYGDNVRTTNLTGEFFESYLYTRSSARFFETFVKSKMLPPSAARERPPIANINTYKPTPEPAVRLGRTGGVVAWVFGEPTPVDNASAFPGAWIEQDMFVLKKVRLMSQAEMVLGDHKPAPGGLKLARERSITWKSNDAGIVEPRSATIKVVSVKNLPDKSLAPQFLATSITPGEIKAARLPDSPVVREFYSRFR